MVRKRINISKIHTALSEVLYNATTMAITLKCTTSMQNVIRIMGKQPKQKNKCPCCSAQKKQNGLKKVEQPQINKVLHTASMIA